MSEFKFSCPQCGQHILCDTQWSGLEINCPACQQTLAAPSLESPAPAITEPMHVTPPTAAVSPPRPPGRIILRVPSPGIPLVVRIYGILAMSISVLGVIVMVLLLAGLLPAGGGLGLVIFGAVILYFIVVFRIGKGMRAGERQAIYGFCLVCLIDSALRVFRFSNTHDTKYLWYLAFALGLFYVPPLVSAFRHWASFK